jgi:hypothetical protein
MLNKLQRMTLGELCTHYGDTIYNIVTDSNIELFQLAT